MGTFLDLFGNDFSTTRKKGRTVRLIKRLRIDKNKNEK